LYVEAESLRRREGTSVQRRMTNVIELPEIGASLITPSWVKTWRRRDSTEAGAFSSPTEVVSSVREPYAFISHVRFDKRDVETEHEFDTKTPAIERFRNSAADQNHLAAS
jgi:hypothetical protein